MIYRENIKAITQRGIMRESCCHHLTITNYYKFWYETM